MIAPLAVGVISFPPLVSLYAAPRLPVVLPASSSYPLLSVVLPDSSSPLLSAMLLASSPYLFFPVEVPAISIHKTPILKL